MKSDSAWRLSPDPRAGLPKFGPNFSRHWSLTMPPGCDGVTIAINQLKPALMIGGIVGTEHMTTVGPCVTTPLITRKTAAQSPPPAAEAVPAPDSILG